MIVERYIGDRGQKVAEDVYRDANGKSHTGRRTEEFNLGKSSIRHAVIDTHYGTVKLEINAILYDRVDKEKGGRMIVDSQEFVGDHLKALSAASKHLANFKKTFYQIK